MKLVFHEIYYKNHLLKLGFQDEHKTENVLIIIKIIVCLDRPLKIIFNENTYLVLLFTSEFTI